MSGVWLTEADRKLLHTVAMDVRSILAGAQSREHALSILADAERFAREAAAEIRSRAGGVTPPAADLGDLLE